MAELNLTLNGASLNVPAGTTLLEAARRAGVYVPHLCDYPGLVPLPDVVPDMACQLCLVAADGQMVLACHTPAADGMRVDTRTPQVMDALRRSLNSILRRYPATEMTRELKTAVEYAGIKKFPEYTDKKFAPRGDSPFFVRDHNKCVLCERCVRVCGDIRGANVLEFSYPCHNACPAHIDIPRYLRLIARGRPASSLAVIREKVPFPGSLGRVCVHPCEQSCQRGLEIDQPLNIRMLKRYAADNGGDGWKARQWRQPATGRRVAVVGAGPSGLTAAFYLAKLGHGVTVFEALPEAGGMMRVGIPEYRLPRDVLTAEVNDIAEVGVDIKYNTRVADVPGLLKDGYAAVYLAVGAHAGMSLGVDGEDSPGVIDAAEFLRRANLGEKVPVGESVGVVGGGNVAIDAARMSLRLGAKKVTIFYRRTRAEMPANPEEIEAALEEDIENIYLAAPTKIAPAASGKLVLTCQRMQLGEPDDSGRRRPEPIPGSEFETELDSLVGAIGQRPQVPESFGVEKSRWDTVNVDAHQMATLPGVFSGGDCVSGPATVIEAIAAGRDGASAIDRYLGGSGDIAESLVPPEEAEYLLSEDIPEEQQAVFKHLPPAARAQSYDEVELGMDDATAVREAQRCLKCYVVAPAGELDMETAGCQFCGACVDACPTGAVLERSVIEGPPPERVVTTTCGYCGVGCRLQFEVAGEKIVRVLPDPDGPANQGQACVKGKFGQDFVRHPDRLKTPLVKRDGVFVPVSWDEALDLVAARLKDHRPEETAVFSSARCTNEDNYVVQKLTRAVIGTNSLDHCARL